MSAIEEQSNTLSQIIQSLNLTEQGVQDRKAFLDINASDANLLKNLADPIRKSHEHIMQLFYSHLDNFDTTKNKIQGDDLRKRLHEKQKHYLNELFNGVYDKQYVLNRLNVGLIHQKVGLSPQWYIGAYSKYVCNLLPEVLNAVNHDTEKAIDTIKALLKVVFLDIGLVLETYFEADRRSIQALKDYSENIVCSVPAGLIVLDKNLIILSANRQLDKLKSGGHNIFTGLHLKEILSENDIVERAMEVVTKTVSQTGIQVTKKDRFDKTKQFSVSIIPMFLQQGQTGITRTAKLLIVIEDISEQEQLKIETRNTDSRLRAMLNHIPDGIIVIDDIGEIESFNPAAEALFEYKSNEIIGKNIKTLMPEHFSKKHDEYLFRYINQGIEKCIGSGFRELEGLKKSGNVFSMDLSINEMKIGKEVKFIGVIRDITKRKKDEMEMKKLSYALEQTADAIMITDNNGSIEYVNRGFESMTGYTKEDVLNQNPRFLKSGKQDREFYHQLWKNISQGIVFREILINRKKNGILYYEEKTITPLFDKNSKITHYISSGKDITERMSTQKRLHYLAHHDMLTDLPNRLMFMDKLNHVIKLNHRNDHPVALIYIDLDQFKNINDSLGHQVGDDILVMTADRLRKCVKDIELIARFSGDEFCILIEDIKSIKNIPSLVQKIINELAIPYLHEKGEFHITASIGVSVSPIDSIDPHELVKFSEVAMFRAKFKGRNNFQLYKSELNLMSEERLLLENQLRKALERKEFVVHYQPQINLKTKRVTCMEALLRWQHPTRGLLYPIDFIDMLEDTRLIIPVGEWVLNKACQQLKIWRDNHFIDINIAVNVSPRQLINHSFYDFVCQCISNNKFPASFLHLEIIESSIMEDDKVSTQTIKDLHQRGISFAIDDFGTGYSSLSYLQRFPISIVKIDKSFIADIPEDKGDCDLTRAIISMCQITNQKVIAEGVETIEQLNFLEQYGCDITQGFYHSKPLTASATLDYLSKFNVESDTDTLIT